MASHPGAFGLVQAYDRFRERVIESIPDDSYRWCQAGQHQRLRKIHARILRRIAVSGQPAGLTADRRFRPARRVNGGPPLPASLPGSRGCNQEELNAAYMIALTRSIISSLGSRTSALSSACGVIALSVSPPSALPPPASAAVLRAAAVIPVVIASASRNSSCSPSPQTSSPTMSAWLSTRRTVACAA